MESKNKKKIQRNGAILRLKSLVSTACALLFRIMYIFLFESSIGLILHQGHVKLAKVTSHCLPTRVLTQVLHSHFVLDA